MWVYDIIVLFEFRFLYIWQINLYTEGLDRPPLIAWITTAMWNEIVIGCWCFGKEISGWARTRTSGLGWRLTWGHYPPCSIWLVFLCFDKSIGLSHKLVSQKKKNKKKNIFTLLSLGCETWNLSETWEPLSISWDKIRFGWECEEDTILWTYGLGRLFFFSTTLVVRTPILELVSLKFRIWKKPGEFA